LENLETYQKIIAGQIAALENVLLKKDAQLKKALQHNEQLVAKINDLEKDIKTNKLQKAANNIFKSNLPVEDKQQLLQQIQGYIKAVELAIKNAEQFATK
jgi:hypothetical protein